MPGRSPARADRPVHRALTRETRWCRGTSDGVASTPPRPAPPGSCISALYSPGGFWEVPPASSRANPALPGLSPALWTFLWFVGFCFLTNQWVATQSQDVLVGADSARAAITFSFFSIFSWVGGRAARGLVSLGAGERALR